jgi:hypothetical protein
MLLMLPLLRRILCSPPLLVQYLNLSKPKNIFHYIINSDFKNNFCQGLSSITSALGSSIHHLHTKIVEIVDSEVRSKQKDFTGRFQRELAYVQYINPIAVLCLEVYELDIPLLQTSEVRTAVCGLSLLERDYKKVIFGSRISN